MVFPVFVSLILYLLTIICFPASVCRTGSLLISHLLGSHFFETLTQLFELDSNKSSNLHTSAVNSLIAIKNFFIQLQKQLSDSCLAFVYTPSCVKSLFAAILRSISILLYNLQFPIHNAEKCKPIKIIIMI